MILFWVICALLIVIALAFVLPPFLQRSEKAEGISDEERKQANISVYRDQLSELEADLRNGIIAEDQYTQDREEIERRLLEDTATTRSKKAANFGSFSLLKFGPMTLVKRQTSSSASATALASISGVRVTCSVSTAPSSALVSAESLAGGGGRIIVRSTSLLVMKGFASSAWAAEPTTSSSSPAASDAYLFMGAIL